MNNRLIINKIRTFNECMSDGIRLIKSNGNTFINAFLNIILPIILTVSLFQILYQMYTLAELSNGNDSSVDQWGSQWGESLLINIGIIIMVMSLIIPLFIHMASLYKIKGNQAINYHELKQSFKSSYFKICIGSFCTLTMIYLPFIIGLLCFWIGIGLGMIMTFIGFLGSIYLYITYIFTPFIQYDQSLSWIASLRKGSELSRGQKGNIFGLLLIAHLLAWFLSVIFSLPSVWMAGFVTFTTDYDQNSQETIQNILLGATTLFAVLGSIFSKLYITSVLTVKYFDLDERLDGKSLRERIADINLEPEKLFENEGEY